MKVRFRDGLPYKQAKITFIIAFFLGLLMSAALLYLDLRREMADVEVRMKNVGNMLSRSAGQAMKNSDTTLAADMADGLLQARVLSRVRLFDVENNLLAESKNTPSKKTFTHNLLSVFYPRDLVYRFPVFYGDDNDFVGYGEVYLNTDYISKNFIDSSQTVIVGAFLSTVGLLIILGMVYHFTVIRRIQKIASDLSNADPERDSPCKIALSESGSKDELGVLVKSLNTLFERYDDAMQKISRTEELKAAKDEADRANRLKTEFLANISHEIRTPMNIILGFTSVLEKEVKSSEHLKLLGAVRDNGSTLMKLINDLLDLSKIESGKLDIYPSPIDMEELFKETELVFSETVSSKNIRLILEPEKSKIVLMMDGIRLRQIIFNLVGNAIKFTEEGYVKISYKTAKESKGLYALTLSVEDTGIGIDSSQLDSVFENFTQQEGQNHAKYGGTGLGLAITKKLAEAMNGEVSVTSAKGKGSVFTVHFTAVQVSSALLADLGEVREEVCFRPAKILIADDSDRNRLLLKLLLRDQPFEFIEAEDGQEAVEKAKEHMPALILMDMKMPVTDGFTATRILKANPATASIPIVAVSADVISERTIKATDAGCSAYVKKPVIITELINTLQVFMEYETITLTEEKPESQKYGLTKEQQAVIKEKLGERWKSISRSFMMSDMETFAAEAMLLAETENIKELKNWSEKLAKDVKEFDIDSLTGTIDNFAGFIKETK